MRDIPPQPSPRPVARFARRYGSTFNAFDHLANVSLCSQQLGQVEIDCRFRHSKTQWGVLGPAENQAGILYMDLTFAQTKHCRLSSATVLVSLEDPENVPKDGKSSAAPTRSSPREDRLAAKGRPASGYGTVNPIDTTVEATEDWDELRFLQFTQDFGPRELAGEATRATTKKTKHVTPQVNVMGSGGGGMGWDREQSIEQSSRWTFTGNLLRGSKLGDNGLDIVYRTIRWELSEDDFQPQTTHSNTIQTAFTLEHDEKLFVIRIEIQGKLERRHERVKNHVKNLLKFPKDPSKSQGVSLTVVNPRAEKTQRRLDAIARGIPFDMERLNFEAVRPQIPTTLPLSFQRTTQISADESTTTATAVEEPYPGPSTTDQTARTRLPDYQPPERISSFPEEEEIIVRRAPTNEIPVKTRGHVREPSARTQMSRVTNESEQSPTQIPVGQRKSRYGGAHSRRETERHEQLSRESRVEEVVGPKPAGKPVQISPSLEPSDGKPSEDDLTELASRLVQYPFLLRIMLWLISMMNSTSTKPPRKTLKSE
ncbi:uncharacterized protein N7496_009070 [Penicillium cataractarum]|uniref:Uncharacterized protein n=1 Tax=Penicillium cataractarum TaxID=2100454 RepID=A0A9W9V7I5_9EURO|nr:uncharacterized protein N7496_009070 [Penicillium cataractarum]KAJ5369310.1 hypothetical protein N7496_009070 [Penicillium cataractarum]